MDVFIAIFLVNIWDQPAVILGQTNSVVFFLHVTHSSMQRYLVLFEPFNIVTEVGQKKLYMKTLKRKWFYQITAFVVTFSLYYI